MATFWYWYYAVLTTKGYKYISTLACMCCIMWLFCMKDNVYICNYLNCGTYKHSAHSVLLLCVAYTPCLHHVVLGFCDYYYFLIFCFKTLSFVFFICVSIHSFPISLSVDRSEWQDGGVHQRPGNSFSQCCTHAHTSETQRHLTGLPPYSSQFSSNSCHTSIFNTLHVSYFTLFVSCKSTL